MLLPIAIVALAATVTAIPSPLAGRIVDGEDARIESHPYQVSVNLLGQHRSGGVIIGKNLVLTTAYCIGEGIGGMVVRAGSSLVNDGGSLHRVLEAHHHEQFQINELGALLYDVALLRVEEAFVFDETRQPIELFAANEQVPAGARAVVSGWGSTSETAIEIPVYLQSFVLSIVDRKSCDRAYASFGGLPTGLICARSRDSNGKSCLGDQGGPLVVDGRLAGLVAWGYDCTNPHLPGMYTEIAYLRDWIDKHAQL